PVILGLVGLATLLSPPQGQVGPGFTNDDATFWNVFHGTFMLLATVGMCVGFVASLMYLVQAHRLRAKLPPGQGLKLMSLERLERMNRLGIILAFPLLTAGLLVGAALMVQEGASLSGWTDPKVISVLILWLVF